jgi:hypothetical protein
MPLPLLKEEENIEKNLLKKTLKCQYHLREGYENTQLKIFINRYE